MENIFEILNNIGLIQLLVGFVVGAVVFGVNKLPAAIRDEVVNLIDKLDTKLEEQAKKTEQIDVKVDEVKEKIEKK